MPLHRRQSPIQKSAAWLLALMTSGFNIKYQRICTRQIAERCNPELKTGSNHNPT
jgi:hypothetical protein